MKINKYEDRDVWLSARRGKITGSRLKDIVVKRGTGQKIGFYELIAERLGIPADGENAMDRGTRLEEEAIAKFTEETKKKVNTDLVIWERDENESIAISPDGYIGKDKITEAVEIKCLASSRHIEAWLTKEVPNEYDWQKLQYFIVNDDLQTLYFAFYDPRLTAKPFFYFTIKRKDIQGEVDIYLEYQRKTLEEINRIVCELTNF